MKNIVIVDIDGTIADCTHRLHYLENNDWDSFYEACDKDKPIQPIIDLVKILTKSYRVIFCTGRRGEVGEKTGAWLQKYFGNTLPSYHYHMRKIGDRRPDTIIKPEMIEKYKNNIAFILEDRDSMVQKWRELGYTCLQTQEGNF
jgi:uncharacterized HAD superfamily protein